MSSTTQLYAYIALTAYLGPCAWQDWRTRKVSNWLTVPAFVVAWPLALWFGNLEWTVAVFLGCYVAWQFKGMGAADGKLATLMAAVEPSALILALLLLCAQFVVLRLIRHAQHSIAGAPMFLAGVVTLAILTTLASA